MNYTYRRHLIDNGRLIYSDLPLGGVGYICEICGGYWRKGKSTKGGSMCPFDKNVKDAGEVAQDARGEPISNFEDVTLQLNRYKISPTGKFGDVIKMYCTNEDGKELIVSTFSEVVQRQAEELEGKLPVLITIRKVSNYFTIY